MKATDKLILNNILNLTRNVLQPYPLLSIKQKKRIIKKNKIFKNQLHDMTPIRRSKILSFISLMLEEHPIFESPRFLSPREYYPLHPESYNTFHKILDTKKYNIHGNNYLYTKTNLRNGLLFTYHDIETDSYIPVTFNTNFPICMIVPDPFCVKGNVADVIDRMTMYFSILSKKGHIKSFPIIFKGLDAKTASLLSQKINFTKIENDSDITTIPAEVNYPAISYNILSLKKMVDTHMYNKNKNKKKPKIINVVKKLEPIIYCEEWQFDQKEAKYIARKWALSKIARLKHRGIENVSLKYMTNTVIESISQQPPGAQNDDFFTIAIRSKEKQGKIQADQLLGIVIASKNSKTIAALNAVVVPVNKTLRDLGYYTVYKLAEKMSTFGITSYWHGPKELESDVNAVIEFMGKPDISEKKYCIKYTVGKFMHMKYKRPKREKFLNRLSASL